jgi:DNA-binding beta-propeller fold protein YncE
MLWTVSSAQASELLYWDNYQANTVASANLDGSGGGSLNLTGTELEAPEGMAYDSVTNRLFVANAGGPGSGQVSFVNLDGSGAGVFTAPGAVFEEPEGVTVDPVTRMIYWLNTEGTGSVGWAKLDGSAGGLLNATGTVVKGGYRLALDPVAGRVYWANESGVYYVNVNNTGGGKLDTTGATPTGGSSGIAVDPAGNRVYWLNDTLKTVSFASLTGGAGGELNLGGAPFNGGYGLALDPALGRLYWANYANKVTATGAFGFTNLAGGGGAINIATAPVNGPQDPVILKSPIGTEAPKATRSSKSRSSLSCSTGGWAADDPGSFVYQAPRAFAYQWTSKGKSIKGATSAAFRAKSAGKYACVVTASNQAGSASQTSAAISVNAAKVKLTVKKKVGTAPGGVAKFKVKAANQGDLKSKSARVCVKVAKKYKSDLKAPKCKSLGALKSRGKRTATLKVKVGQSAGGSYPVTFSVRGSAGTSAKAKILVK